VIRLSIAALVLASALSACRAPPAPGSTPAAVPDAPIHHAKITILSTTRAEVGTGEWGFSALVEVDDTRILFDTGAGPRTVLDNAAALGIDLSTVDTVVVSHHHNDHVGGLVTLRETLRDEHPNALATVHAARGIFTPRRFDGPAQVNAMLGIRERLPDVTFVVHDGPTELAPGVWLTGPVPRRHDERNWTPKRHVEVDGAWVEDTLTESQSLILDTEQGLVVLSGCGHAGIVNAIDHARAEIRDAPVHAAIGGFHLQQAHDQHLRWTAEQLARVDLGSMLGAHCTGDEAVARFRDWLQLGPQHAVVATVGARWDLEQGIRGIVM